MATASRPGSAGKLEIESADDFVLTKETSLTMRRSRAFCPRAPRCRTSLMSASRLSRLPEGLGRGPDLGPADIQHPPGAHAGQLALRCRTRRPECIRGHTLTFTPGIIHSSFTAANSVLNGINPKPNFHTGGDGSVTGQEVQFNVLFSKPFDLPADHYFFVPQVELTSGDFFWLSAARPIVPPGTPFPAGFTDLQEWIRNENLAPDWLRVGTDIVGGNPPTFNAAFSLSGSVVPEPGSVFLLFLGGIGVLGVMRVKKQQIRA